jgi:curved DNA-binding protein CbpA
MSGNSSNDRMPVAFAGDIKQMTLPWLFQALRTQSKTGTVVFKYFQERTAEKAVKKVYFKNGDAIFASSSLQDDWLGRWLVRAGKITEQQCAASEELVKKIGKKQGALLVELGFLSPQMLVEGLKHQVKQIIMSLFSIGMGSYQFDEGPLPMADIIPLQMSTGNLILEGVTGLEWQAIRKALPAPTTIVRPTTDPSCLFQDAYLTEDQRTVFSLVDGKNSIEEICSQSGVGDFNALKAIYLLLALRMAEIGEIKSESEMEFAREAVQEAVRPSATKEQKTVAAPARPAEPEAIATREMVEKAFGALAGQDHYQVLGVMVTATSPDLKKAYFRLAKSYHPDRHFDPTMADLKHMLEALFDRIHKAYTVLSDQVKRAEYDRSAAKKPQPAVKAADEFVEKRAEGYQEDYKEKVVRAAEQFNNGMKDFKSALFLLSRDLPRQHPAAEARGRREPPEGHRARPHQGGIPCRAQQPVHQERSQDQGDRRAEQRTEPPSRLRADQRGHRCSGRGQGLRCGRRRGRPQAGRNASERQQGKGSGGAGEVQRRDEGVQGQQLRSGGGYACSSGQAGPDQAAVSLLLRSVPATHHAAAGRGGRGVQEGA